jgi:hypothetical protein
MKKILFTLGFIAASLGGFAQSGGSTVNKAISSASHSRDFLMIQYSYDGWAGAPDSVKTGFNRGFNIALMYDFPIKQSHFSLAAGLGISTSGVYLKDHRIDMSKAAGSSEKIAFIKDGYYSKFKVATTYLEIPIEFRYRQVEDNANKGFKASLGVKAGLLANAHTKGKNSVGGDKNIDKVLNKRFFNTWRLAATARVGYGNFSLFGSYNISPMFKENTGQGDIRPYSIGICLSGL